MNTPDRQFEHAGAGLEPGPVIRESADAAEIWFQRPGSSPTFQIQLHGGALPPVLQPAIPAFASELPRPRSRQ